MTSPNPMRLSVIDYESIGNVTEQQEADALTAMLLAAPRSSSTPRGMKGRRPHRAEARS